MKLRNSVSLAARVRSPEKTAPFAAVSCRAANKDHWVTILRTAERGRHATEVPVESKQVLLRVQMRLSLATLAGAASTTDRPAPPSLSVRAETSRAIASPALLATSVVSVV